MLMNKFEIKTLMTQKLKVSFTDKFGDPNSLNFAEIRINLDKVIFFFCRWDEFKSKGRNLIRDSRKLFS